MIMKKIQELKFIELVIIYLALYVLYVVTPQSLQIVRRFVSPLMLATIGVILLNSLQFFKG